MKLVSKVKDLLDIIFKIYQELQPPEKIRNDIYFKINLLRKKVQVDTELISYEVLDKELQKFNIRGIYFDRKYNVLTKVEDLKKVIEIDWTNYRHYVTELYDCDDFARVFKSHCMEIWYLNGIGYVIGRVFDMNGNLLGYHAFNLIPIKIGNEIKFMVYEPQTDTYTELSPENKTKLNNVIYVIDLVIW